MEDELQILVIDDDQVDRMSIHRSIRKAEIPASIDDAESIEHAWKCVFEKEYDCIFLDYRLPGGNGLELLREFRAKGLLMPVIVVTSQGDEGVAVEVMKLGGTDYLSKHSLKQEGVSQVLRNAIRAHKAERERLQTAEALKVSQARLAEAQRIA
ncbi:MAG TPA: response regulator, partial [Bacteroidetes bacterium]|nr:response regulator [Bacteroidota bacterium]